MKSPWRDLIQPNPPSSLVTKALTLIGSLEIFSHAWRTVDDWARIISHVYGLPTSQKTKETKNESNDQPKGKENEDGVNGRDRSKRQGNPLSGSAAKKLKPSLLASTLDDIETKLAEYRKTVAHVRNPWDVAGSFIKDVIRTMETAEMNE